MNQFEASKSSDGAPAKESELERAELKLHGYANRGAVGYRSPDEALQQEVCQALIEDSTLDADGVAVRVRAAVVTLEGHVPNASQKEQAFERARGVAGVREVRNRLSSQ